jgi:soluble lytic murein transglycosylase
VTVRRRLLLIFGVAAGAGLLAAVIIPNIHRAVDELTLPLRHEDIIRQQAADKHLDPALLAGVIYAESKFEDRTSAAGAEGLMQLTPATAEYIAHLSGGTRFTLDDLSTPQVNISYGAYYLRYLLDHYKGNLALALAAYNAGLGNVDGWVRTGRSRVSQWPFAETRAYIRRVIDAAAKYRKTYSRELGL